MIRILLLFSAFGALASCAEYREPQANCFAFRASLEEVEPVCVFTPLGNAEDGVDT
ncbi:hypothetical protein ACFO5X_19465 [Seohaeicola nanhaiensis]|uniref:Uncharacterized protein n=1 Tax=Seohaeicola nanhaiensis TaxID=1387282 RepID=A0ABV9KL91_9RHOB